MELGRSADAVVVAPATARLIGSYAAGISSDLLTATLLATRAPVLVCPAMHAEMWEHAAVQDNVALLRRRGVHVLEPAEGRLAGGDFGKGRLPEPEAIVAALAAMLAACAPGPLDGVKAVVSAGGTREALDPVRYIANRSSGKQGYAVAAELAGRGAAVTLVTSSALAPPPWVDVVRGRKRGPNGNRPSSPPPRTLTWSSWPRPWPTTAPPWSPRPKAEEDRRAHRRSSWSLRWTSWPSCAPGAVRAR